MGEPQLGVELPGVGAGQSCRPVLDIFPDPVEGQFHVGVDVPGVLGLWLGLGGRLDHVGAEERGDVLGVGWIGGEVHIVAIWVERMVLLGRAGVVVLGSCSTSLYIF